MSRYFLPLLFLLFALPCEAQFFTLRPSERKSFRVMTTSEIDSLKRRGGKGVDNVDSTSSHSQEYIQNRNASSIGGFSSPLSRELVINSGFGRRKDPFSSKYKFHFGVDLHSRSDAVFSMLRGRVKKTGYEKRGYGNFVTVSYGDFDVTYAHLSSILVSKGDVIPAGTPIGVSGSTGRATGDHLHISLKFRGKTVDPTPFLLFITKRSLKESINRTIQQYNNIATIQQ